MEHVLATKQLELRRFTLDDAEFVLGLLNEDTVIRFIGDKNVRSMSAAHAYLRNGPLQSYQEHGFGLYAVQLKSTQTCIGMCGLLKREVLDHPDLGFAFLPEYCGYGYATEAAQAVMHKEIELHGLEQILAITLTDNVMSQRLLARLGFNMVGNIEYADVDNRLFEYCPR